jgi:hypothetical protein
MTGYYDRLFLENLYRTKLPHLSRRNNHTQEFSPNESILTNRNTSLAVPWLRSLVAGLSPRRPVFAPGSVHVGLVVDKVALGQVFLRVFQFSPVNRSFHRRSPNSYHLGNAQYASEKAGIHARVWPTQPSRETKTLVSLNPLRPRGNYMNNLLWQSVMLHFVFIGFLWFSM